MPIAPTEGPQLAHLRAVTRRSHDALENALGLDGMLDLDAYRKLLARFHGFWIGWEPQVAALLDEETLSGPRRRLHLLAADLAALGLSAEELDALPRCPLTPLRDAAAALGSLYVMEGSTLGGRVIQRNLEHSLGAEGAGSRAYFNGYGPETGRMWLSFLTRLEAAPAAAADRIGEGAVATFERLGWWLLRG
jgi:heme oxygenase